MWFVLEFTSCSFSLRKLHYIVGLCISPALTELSRGSWLSSPPMFIADVEVVSSLSTPSWEGTSWFLLFPFFFFSTGAAPGSLWRNRNAVYKICWIFKQFERTSIIFIWEGCPLLFLFHYSYSCVLSYWATLCWVEALRSLKFQGLNSSSLVTKQACLISERFLDCLLQLP